MDFVEAFDALQFEGKCELIRGAQFVSVYTEWVYYEGVLDSLAFIDLVVFIEEQTGQPVDLLDIDPEEFTTIRGLCDAALAGMSG